MLTPDAIDITVGVTLFLSMLIAYFRGLIREIFTIVTMFASMGASYFGGPLMLQPFEKWFNVNTPEAKEQGRQAAEAVIKATQNGTDVGVAKAHLFMGVLPYEQVAQICSFASVFLFIYIVMSLIGFFLTRAVAESGLGIVDRLLGAGFGLFRGALLVFLAYLPVSYYYQGTHKEMEPWAKNSVSVQVLDKSVAYVDEHINLSNVIHDAGDMLANKVKKHAAQQAQGKDERAPLRDETHKPDVNAIAPSEEDQKELQDELKGDDKKAPPQ
jgi:uncharacterized membrane protein required for colicin V production